MQKLFVNNILKAFVFIFVPTALSVGIICLISLWVEMITVLIYVIAGLISLATCFIFKTWCFPKVLFFYRDQIDKDSLSENNIWIKSIKEKRFIKLNQVRLMFCAYLILAVIAVVNIILFHTVMIDGRDDLIFIAFAAICAALIGVSITSTVYGVLGLLTTKGCKKCGAVNAFIYDESLEGVSANTYGSNMNYGVARVANPTALFFKGAPWIRNRGSSYGERIQCHCACCSSKCIITDSWSNVKY